jgi:hypothetical protein
VSSHSRAGANRRFGLAAAAGGERAAEARTYGQAQHDAQQDDDQRHRQHCVHAVHHQLAAALGEAGEQHVRQRHRRQRGEQHVGGEVARVRQRSPVDQIEGVRVGGGQLGAAVLGERAQRVHLERPAKIGGSLVWWQRRSQAARSLSKVSSLIS